MALTKLRTNFQSDKSKAESLKVKRVPSEILIKIEECMNARLALRLKINNPDENLKIENVLI